jgi:hypothetical protein
VKKGSEQPTDVSAIAIPDGTPITIIDRDHESEMVRIEYSADGKVMRAWVPAAHFEKLQSN